MLKRLNLLTKKQEALLLSILATLPYSMWGLFINWDYGPMVAARVAVLQAVMSFTITLFMTRLLQGLYGLSTHRIGRFLLAWWGTVVIINTTAFTIHTIAGTPERLLTMAPGMVAGFIYCLSYTTRMAADKNFDEKN